MKKTIAIILEGGLVQAVVANEKMPDIQVMVIDYDTAYAEAEEVVMVPPVGEGKGHSAYVSVHPIEQATIDWGTVLHRHLNDIHPTDEEFGNE